MNYIDTYERWLQGVTEEERGELSAIFDNKWEIRERFAAPLSFGTAGMRGEVGLGTYRMNDYTVRRATLGLARFICGLGREAMDRGVVISYDTRRFSLRFALVVAEVLSYAKIRSYVFEDVRPVPMCSFAVRRYNAIAGVMITASHNPKQYNGYKVYGEDGAQMSPEDTAVVVKYINEIEDYFISEYEAFSETEIKGKDGLKLSEYATVIGKEADEEYYGIIEKLSLSPEAVAERGRDLKLVYTPLHGAGYIPVTTILKRIGIKATVVTEQALPDTEFSTVSAPNPENKDALMLGIMLGNELGADVVIGTDPDCDRMGIAVRNFDNEFVLLNGNQIGALLLDYILQRLSATGKLPKNGAMVKTIVTTTLADKIAADYGVKVFDVLTGFKFIGEKIKEWEKSGEYEFLFGYEESYGYLRGTHARDKDAVVASMLTAEMVCYYESIGKGLYRRLIELFEKYGYYYESNLSVVYKGIDAMSEMAHVMERMREISISDIGGEGVLSVSDFVAGVKTLADGSREKLTLPKTDALLYSLSEKQFICIRPSGTEPKLKLYVLCFASDLQSSRDKGDRLLLAVKEIVNNQTE